MSHVPLSLQCSIDVGNTARNLHDDYKDFSLSMPNYVCYIFSKTIHYHIYHSFGLAHLHFFLDSWQTWCRLH